jgi:hypothetical protein
MTVPIPDREIIGYVVLQLSGGCLSDTSYVLRNAEEAIREATEIIDSYWKDDRYANPEHRSYDPRFAEDTQEKYDELYELVRSLKSAAINEDDDLLILPIVKLTKESKSK